MSYSKNLDTKVIQVFNSNENYFKMLKQWHDLHGGLSVEPEVKAIIESQCKAGAVVLEAGSGAGNITNWFATQFPGAHFVGVDISQIGIAMARQGAPGNARFYVADLKNLPFSEGVFDFCFSQSVIEHIVGWEEAVVELRRMLVPGGQLLIRVNNGNIDSISRRRAFFRYLFRMNKASLHTGSFELRNGNWGDHESNFDVQEIPSNVLLRTLRKAGFTISYFTTGIHRGRQSPVLKARLLSYLNFWPFNHLGSTTIVLARKQPRPA